MRQQQRQLDVLERRQDRDEVVELEDESDVVGPPAGDLAFGHPADFLVVDDHRAGRRPIEAGDQVEERRLAGTRGSHQGEELPFVDRQVESRQHWNPEFITLVFLSSLRAGRSTRQHS